MNFWRLKDSSEGYVKVSLGVWFPRLLLYSAAEYNQLEKLYTLGAPVQLPELAAGTIPTASLVPSRPSFFSLAGRKSLGTLLT